MTWIGFDWHTLPRGSVIVDVGGGIGSTSMLLASAFSSHGEDSPSLRFIIQDRPIVVEMGEKVGSLFYMSLVLINGQAWRAKCPEFLESGTALFQGTLCIYFIVLWLMHDSSSSP